ncbi:MAG: GAK system CofD-like protein [Pseudomonadota bacterium]
MLTSPSLSLTRSLILPDAWRLARYRRAPEVGPKVLFFSGGSALHGLSRQLIEYTHNSIHVISTFDSGGSSAVLRRAFAMPAVGDLRNRLMSLAEPSVQGNPQVVRLFAHRLPAGQEPDQLAAHLEAMVAGRHPLVAQVPDPLRKIIRSHLGHLAQNLPPDFDLAGASVGNLVLTGGYLNYGRHLDPVIFLFSKLAEVRGVVRPVLNQNLHLAARLADGRLLAGQHLLTGRTAPPIDSPVSRLFLTRGLDSPKPLLAQVRQKTLDLIDQAELICFPMGSFYTSLVANLLPRGICQAIAAAQCPKVYIPNPAGDPEQLGLDLAGGAAVLLQYLRQGCDEQVETARLLNFIIIDSRADYPGGPADPRALRRLGVQVIDAPLVEEPSQKAFDPLRLAGLLLSLV